MDLIVQPDGRVRCVYREEIDLSVLDQLEIRRASHVEPTAEGRWTADMAPVGGPVLGPFCRRGEALAAESQWLDEAWLNEAP